MDNKERERKHARISDLVEHAVIFESEEEPNKITPHKASIDLREIALEYACRETPGYSESFVESLRSFFAKNYEPQGNLTRILLDKDEQGRDFFNFFIDELEKRHQRITKETFKSHKDKKLAEVVTERVLEEDAVGRTFNAIFKMLEDYIGDSKEIKKIVELSKDFNNENLPTHMLKKMPRALDSLFYLMKKHELFDGENISNLLPIAVSARCCCNYTRPLEIILPKLTEFLQKGVLSYNDLYYFTPVQIVKDGVWEKSDCYGIKILDIIGDFCERDGLEKSFKELSSEVARRYKLDSSPKRQVSSAAGRSVASTTSTTCTIS